MQLQNTKETYGWIAIALHWITALGVIAMFVIGVRAWIAGEAGDRAARGELMGLHVSLGAALFVFFAAQIILYYTQPQPAKPQQAPWLNVLANATQNLLLIALAIQILSGPLAVWSGGRAINVFDLFSLPSPFAARNDAVHEFAEIAHGVGRLMILVLASLHVLGALKHLLLDRDGVFLRILIPAKLKEPA